MSIIYYFLISVAVVILDQLSKFIAVKYLMPVSSFPIIKDVIHFTYVENKGAAFGMLQDQRWVFMVISTVMIAVLIFIMVKYKKYFHPLMLIGIAFVFGGGIGNMIDRTLLGYVVDFIDFTLINFAVFNIADSFICVGVGLMLLDVILKKSDLSFLDDKKSEKDTDNETNAD